MKENIDKDKENNHRLFIKSVNNSKLTDLLN